MLLMVAALGALHACTAQPMCMLRPPRSDHEYFRKCPQESTRRTDEEAPMTCIHAEQLIPGRGEPIDQGTVCFNNTIVYAGPTSEMPSLNVTNVVEVPVVMPGMWDTHTHYGGGGGDFPAFVEGYSPDVFIRFGRALNMLKQTLYAGWSSTKWAPAYLWRTGARMSPCI
eukprot:scaffold926_cov408-Prasinococcus_capsulatus_cf.AAC.26